MKAIISPSLLSADFSRLGEEVAALQKAGVRWLHLDVMDGNFVPNITFGCELIRSLRGRCNLFFDVHLMIERPELHLEAFAKAGADLLVLHLEAARHLQRLLELIHGMGIKAGVALNPDSDISALRWVLPYIDLVLVMGVNPGFSGQKFLPETVAKVRASRQYLDALGYAWLPLQVDGGVCPDNIATLVAAGAGIFVSGSAFFRFDDYGKALRIFTEKAMTAPGFAAGGLENAKTWRHNVSDDKG